MIVFAEKYKEIRNFSVYHLKSAKENIRNIFPADHTDSRRIYLHNTKKISVYHLKSAKEKIRNIFPADHTDSRRIYLQNTKKICVYHLKSAGKTYATYFPLITQIHAEYIYTKQKIRAYHLKSAGKNIRNIFPADHTDSRRIYLQNTKKSALIILNLWGKTYATYFPLITQIHAEYIYTKQKIRAYHLKSAGKNIRNIFPADHTDSRRIYLQNTKKSALIILNLWGKTYITYSLQITQIHEE